MVRSEVFPEFWNGSVMREHQSPRPELDRRGLEDASIGGFASCRIVNVKIEQVDGLQEIRKQGNAITVKKPKPLSMTDSSTVATRKNIGPGIDVNSNRRRAEGSSEIIGPVTQ